MIKLHAPRRRPNRAPGALTSGTERGALNLLSIRDVAAYARVSATTVRRWISQSGLKTYRAGKQIRIDERDLIEFLSK
jgi:excisionase family DNA binding protein